MKHWEMVITFIKNPNFVHSQRKVRRPNVLALSFLLEAAYSLSILSQSIMHVEQMWFSIAMPKSVLSLCSINYFIFPYWKQNEPLYKVFKVTVL